MDTYKVIEECVNLGDALSRRLNSVASEPILTGLHNKVAFDLIESAAKFLLVNLRSLLIKVAVQQASKNL